MKRTTVALVLLALCMAAPAVSFAREAEAPPQGAGMPPPPKPGPEHEILAKDVGTWDAKVEVFMTPGAPPMVSTGVETNTLGCSGLCLITDFKGEMGPGQSFQGHGTAVFDSTKKKYVGTWTDSMSTGISTSEATYDPATKTMTGSMEGADMTGKTVRMKSVVEYKDPGTRVFTMYVPGSDGKDMQTMRITYTKKS